MDSRRRGLLVDVAAGVAQQMVFWGCDARQPGLMAGLGLERLARRETGGEGSSRYRALWREGCVELHSFCAGWYPGRGEGVIFVRHLRRILACTGGKPPSPGAYEGRIVPRSPDEIVLLVRPFLEWILHYEDRLADERGKSYREACYRHALRMPGNRPWLPPDEGRDWFRAFLADPSGVPRVKDGLRRLKEAA